MFSVVPPLLGDIASWAGTILAVAAVVGLIARSVRKGVDSVKGEITHQLAPIMLEFGPNGGGLRQAVNLIDAKVDANGIAVDANRAAVQVVFDRFDELDRTVKSHGLELREVKAMLLEQVATTATKDDLDEHLRTDDDRFNSIDAHLLRQDGQFDAITSILVAESREKKP